MGSYNLLPYLGNYETITNDEIKSNGGIEIDYVVNSASGNRWKGYGISTRQGNVMKAFVYYENYRWHSGVCCRMSPIGLVFNRYVNDVFDTRNTDTTSQGYYDSETGLYYTEYKHGASVYYIFDPVYFNSLREALDACNDGYWPGYYEQQIPVNFEFGGVFSQTTLQLRHKFKPSPHQRGGGLSVNC